MSLSQSGHRCSLELAGFSQNRQRRRVRVGLEVLPGNDQKPTQKTQPKKGKPVEIPVPKRSDFDKLLERAEKRPAKPKR
jgi:hypothetical protein